jgi:hypothetical protein
MPPCAAPSNIDACLRVAPCRHLRPRAATSPDESPDIRALSIRFESHTWSISEVRSSDPSRTSFAVDDDRTGAPFTGRPSAIEQPCLRSEPAVGEVTAWVLELGADTARIDPQRR